MEKPISIPDKTHRSVTVGQLIVGLQTFDPKRVLYIDGERVHDLDVNEATIEPDMIGGQAGNIFLALKIRVNNK